MKPRVLISAALVAVAALGASASIWDTASIHITCSANATAQDASGTVAVTEGGDFPSPLVAPLISFTADAQLPAGDRAFAYSEVSYGVAPTGSFFLTGNVTAQVTRTNSMISARAESHSGYSIQFEVPGDAEYRFLFGYFSSGVAGIIRDESDSIIAFFDGVSGQLGGQSGFLAAGSYRFEVTTSAASYFPFGFAYEAEIYGLEFFIGPSRCPSDFTSDWQVDDADFGIFAASYDILDCADAGMPVGCPGDLNGDYVVDDADFTLFAAAYDALVCS